MVTIHNFVHKMLKSNKTVRFQPYFVIFIGGFMVSIAIASNRIWVTHFFSAENVRVSTCETEGNRRRCNKTVYHPFIGNCVCHSTHRSRPLAVISIQFVQHHIIVQQTLYIAHYRCTTKKKYHPILANRTAANTHLNLFPLSLQWCHPVFRLIHRFNFE